MISKKSSFRTEKLPLLELYEDSALIAREDINCTLLIKDIILNADNSA